MSTNTADLLMAIHCVKRCKVMIGNIEIYIKTSTEQNQILAEDYYFENFTSQLRVHYVSLELIISNFENTLAREHSKDGE